MKKVEIVAVFHYAVTSVLRMRAPGPDVPPYLRFVGSISTKWGSSVPGAEPGPAQGRWK